MLVASEITIADLMAFEATHENPDPWPPDLKLKETSDPCTDAANAQRFAEHFGRDVLYIDGLSWHRFNGKCWIPDKNYADRCAQELGSLIRDESIQNTLAASNTELTRAERDAAQKKAEALLMWAKRSESIGHITATQKLATAHLYVRPSDMDAHPWLLNCSNGTLDLQTGKLRSAKRAELITKSTPVPYDPDASYDLWQRALLSVCCDDWELLRYMQRVFGYSLTGDTREQIMFIFNGSGANGKDTILGRVKKAMGDYAALAAPSLLMVSRGDRHPTETADLFGIRMAIASESNEHGKLNETLVKQLTGSERLKARKMRQDFFEFPALFKLILMTNHKPVIEGSDYAIWRRIHLVPFNAVYKKGVNRDDSLPEKLDQELPGILRWCVEGCLEWQRIGLQPPEVVQLATQQYKADQDVLAQFFDEKCVFKAQAQVTAKAFYSTYEQWCSDNGERAKSQMWLWPKLEERGVMKDKTRMGFTYRGIGLLDSDNV
jgi:putative DNA primase/helicase